MQTANHVVAQAGYFLAPPKPSPAATSLSAQFHYALSSWTPGGLAILAAIIVAFAFLMVLIKRLARRQQ
jgi:hypothetical protein